MGFDMWYVSVLSCVRDRGGDRGIHLLHILSNTGLFHVFEFV